MFHTLKTKPDPDWELNNPYWIAILSNKEIIYGDGNDPSDDPVWFQLKKYINYNALPAKIRIEKIILKFRSHEIHLDIPKHSEWVYFSKAMGKEWTEENTDKFFVVGIQDTPTMINKHWYKLPELTKHKESANTIEDCKEEFLIFMPVL